MIEKLESDKVFSEKQKIDSDFQFNEKVAGVFDDMVSRSVPFYDEMQRMTSELTAKYAIPGTKVFDLGCSTGTSLLLMDKIVPAGIEFVGIDDSEEMIHKCQQKLQSFNLKRDITLVVSDLTQNVPVDNASVVSMVLVLQFIRPLHRLNIVKQIYDGMVTGGTFILFENIVVR